MIMPPSLVALSAKVINARQPFPRCAFGSWFLQEHFVQIDPVGRDILK
jgi:hypothetical protein